DYVYFTLAGGETVALSAEQAAASRDWHIASRRTNVKLNGVASGPGSVAGALLAPRGDFYDADGEADPNVVLNSQVHSEVVHLRGQVTPAARLVSDSVSTALEGSGDMVGGQMDMGWYYYNLTTHTLSLNDTIGWLLKSGEGDSYARFHATAFAYSSTDGLDVTFEFDVQPSG